jgi:hypothetical protein
MHTHNTTPGPVPLPRPISHMTLYSTSRAHSRNTHLTHPATGMSPRLSRGSLYAKAYIVPRPQIRHHFPEHADTCQRGFCKEDRRPRTTEPQMRGHVTRQSHAKMTHTTHTHIHTHARADAHAHTHTHTHTNTHTHTQTHTHTPHTQTYTHMRTRTRTQTHTHTHSLTHTFTLSFPVHLCLRPSPSLA